MRILLTCMLISAASAAVIQHGGLRQRRDVAEIVSEQKYLPPAKEYLPSEKLAETKAVDEVAVTEAVVETEAEAPQETAVLAKDGYEYKTVRRLYRRDVSETTR